MELSVQKTPRSSTSSARSRQNLALILPLLGLVAYRLATRPPSAPTWSETALDAAGVLLVVAGLWIRVLARQWKAEKAHDGLVTDGLYGWVRHPLYVGSFLLGLGLVLILGDALLLGAFLLFFGVNHGLVLRREEQELETVFGEAYRAYRRRVPALIPHPGAGRGPKKRLARSIEVPPVTRFFLHLSLGALLLGALITSAPVPAAAKSPAPASANPQEPKELKRFEAALPKLGLSAQQKPKITNLLKDVRASIRKIQAAPGAPEEKEEHLKALRTSSQIRLNQILTVSQNEKLKRLMNPPRAPKKPR